MCTNIKNYVPVRPRFGDEKEDKQWGCGYRDDMIAQFKQDLYNKNFTLQNQGKDDEIVTLENRIKFWLNIISFTQGPVPDNLYDYDYNDEGLDCSVRGSERRELKNYWIYSDKNDSEKHQNFYKGNLFKNTQKELCYKQKHLSY